MLKSESNESNESNESKVSIKTIIKNGDFLSGLPSLPTFFINNDDRDHFCVSSSSSFSLPDVNAGKALWSEYFKKPLSHEELYADIENCSSEEIGSLIKFFLKIEKEGQFADDSELNTFKLQAAMLLVYGVKKSKDFLFYKHLLAAITPYYSLEQLIKISDVNADDFIRVVNQHFRATNLIKELIDTYSGLINKIKFSFFNVAKDYFASFQEKSYLKKEEKNSFEKFSNFLLKQGDVHYVLNFLYELREELSSYYKGKEIYYPSSLSSSEKFLWSLDLYFVCKIGDFEKRMDGEYVRVGVNVFSGNMSQNGKVCDRVFKLSYLNQLRRSFFLNEKIINENFFIKVSYVDNNAQEQCIQLSIEQIYGLLNRCIESVTKEINFLYKINKENQDIFDHVFEFVISEDFEKDIKEQINDRFCEPENKSSRCDIFCCVKSDEKMDLKNFIRYLSLRYIDGMDYISDKERVKDYRYMQTIFGMRNFKFPERLGLNSFSGTLRMLCEKFIRDEISSSDAADVVSFFGCFK